MSRFTYEGEGSETWDCTRPKGRLLAFNEIFAAYPQFDDWVFGDVGPTVLPNSLTNSVASAADKVRSLWVGQISAKGNSPQIRIVDGASPGDDAFLFFRTASTVRVYR
ncbi:MAG: hypothetical protein MUE88_07770, partial [Flavobacteriales bacterium]|nr:hypothetical protein [Flavobacteriales bacterium]